MRLTPSLMRLAAERHWFVRWLNVPRWWNGRHAVLRGQCPFGRVSSNLTLGTISCQSRGAMAKW